MLVYRDSELVYNWVRVDWEAGAAGIEELLMKCVISLLSFLLLMAWFLRGKTSHFIAGISAVG